MDRNSLGYQAIIHRQEVLEKQFTQLFTHVYALSLELNKLKNGGETVETGKTTTAPTAPAQRQAPVQRQAAPATAAPENASDAINRLLQSTTR